MSKKNPYRDRAWMLGKTYHMPQLDKYAVRLQSGDGELVAEIYHSDVERAEDLARLIRATPILLMACRAALLETENPQLQRLLSEAIKWTERFTPREFNTKEAC